MPSTTQTTPFISREPYRVPLGAVTRMTAWVREARANALASAELRSMSDRLLEDIGIRRDEIPDVVRGRLLQHR